MASGDISAAADALAAAGGALGRSWIEEGRACDLLFGPVPAARGGAGGLARRGSTSSSRARRRAQAAARRRHGFDHDQVECIDELADYAGLKAEVAAVTERAMRGEIGFEAALAERVALLDGLEGADRPLPRGAGAAHSGRAALVADDEAGRRLRRSWSPAASPASPIRSAPRSASTVPSPTGWTSRRAGWPGRSRRRFSAPTARGRRCSTRRAERGIALGESARGRRRRQRRADAQGSRPRHRLSRQARARSHCRRADQAERFERPFCGRRAFRRRSGRKANSPRPENRPAVSGLRRRPRRRRRVG